MLSLESSKAISGAVVRPAQKRARGVPLSNREVHGFLQQRFRAAMT